MDISEKQETSGGKKQRIFAALLVFSLLLNVAQGIFSARLYKSASVQTTASAAQSGETTEDNVTIDGQYSAFMLCAFLVPLLGGALPCFLLKNLAKRSMPGRLLFQLYDSGLATLTAGCILQGVLEIYGTTNHLITVYWFAGVGLAVTAIALYAAANFLRPI